VLKAAGCEQGTADQWICESADFGGASLGGCDLSFAQFHSSDLSGIDLSGANLTGALLFDSDLTGADLSGADLTGVNWARATTCPDGARVGEDDDTCCSHLNRAVPAAGC
jgi:uncharacterized protein YjbI with pentapeptide repeats